MKVKCKQCGKELGHQARWRHSKFIHQRPYDEKDYVNLNGAPTSTAKSSTVVDRCNTMLLGLHEMRKELAQEKQRLHEAMEQVNRLLETLPVITEPETINRGLTKDEVVF